MKILLQLACALVLAGCQTMSAEHCRSSDWWRFGHRDGYSGGDSLLSLYTAECAPHGTTPDAAAYGKGYDEGARHRLLWWGPPWP